MIDEFKQEMKEITKDLELLRNPVIQPWIRMVGTVQDQDRDAVLPLLPASVRSGRTRTAPERRPCPTP